MQYLAPYINFFLGASAILLQVFSVFLLILFFVSKKNKILDFVGKNFIFLGFVVSAGATVFSLFYSEVMNFAPCYHCWIQRIFLFPQVFLFAIAYFRNDRNVFFYSIPLLVVGFLDALYLNYIYYFNPNSAPCDASGISCVKKLVDTFGGYISIPSLSLTIFVLLLIILLVAYFYKNNLNYEQQKIIQK